MANEAHDQPCSEHISILAITTITIITIVLLSLDYGFHSWLLAYRLLPEDLRMICEDLLLTYLLSCRCSLQISSIPRLRRRRGSTSSRYTPCHSLSPPLHLLYRRRSVVFHIGGSRKEGTQSLHYVFIFLKIHSLI